MRTIIHYSNYIIEYTQGVENLNISDNNLIVIVGNTFHCKTNSEVELNHCYPIAEINKIEIPMNKEELLHLTVDDFIRYRCLGIEFPEELEAALDSIMP